MKDKKLIYISDQRYYLSENNSWYTTSSFPKELIELFDDLDEWIFFGRLYKTENTDKLFKIEIDSNQVEISFEGVWNSKQGIKGYVENLTKYLKILRKNIKRSDILYLKFSFIASYLTPFVSSLKEKYIITHMVGDIETLKLTKSGFYLGPLVYLQKKIYSYIAKKSNLQIFVSNNLKKKYSIEPGYSVVVAESRVMKKDIISTPHLLRNTEANLKLLFVGRISPEKGLLDVIKAIYKSSEVSLDIIGTGDYKSELEKNIKNYNVGSKVRFNGSRRWGDELFECFRNYDFLILPSYSEGLPLVIVEALSMGLPVIASNVGGIPEIIKHKQNGYLFEAGNVKEITNILEEVKVNKKSREDLILKGIETAKKYSLESQLDIFKQAIKVSKERESEK